jgi:hypothetical protein
MVNIIGLFALLQEKKSVKSVKNTNVAIEKEKESLINWY